MKNRFVIFDMDDVIAQMREPMAETLSRLSGKALHHRDWYTLCTKALYDLDFCPDTMARERIIERCHPEADAQIAMRTLREYGYRIAIATARGWHPQGAALTEAWLEKYGLPFDELHVVGIGATDTKTDVFEKLSQKHSLKAFIDDQPRYLEQALAHGSIEHVVAMNRPWNRQMTAEVERVDSLSEFANTLIREKAAVIA